MANTNADINAEATRANRLWWDDLAEVHYQHYDLKVLREGGSLIDPIARHEVGDVNGKRLLHLQCHIGSDTLSWVGLGAEVTGVDFSPKSLAIAKRLARELGLKARWIECDILRLPFKLQSRFDIVLATQGVLCWISDLSEWMKVAARYLKKEGFLYLQDDHPLFIGKVAGYLDLDAQSALRNDPQLMESLDGADYTDSGYISPYRHYEWFWTLDDVRAAAESAGLRIDFIYEFPKIHYKATQDMVRDESGYWELRDVNPSVPLMFTMKLSKA